MANDQLGKWVKVDAITCWHPRFKLLDNLV